jgi:hypothetical protein
MKSQLVELFIEELGTVIGGANPPSSGPGGNLAINEGGGNVQPGGLPRDGSSGPGGNLAINESGGSSPLTEGGGVPVGGTQL